MLRLGCPILAAGGAVLLFAACGYRLVGPGHLPEGLDCVAVGQIHSGAAEAGLEAILARALEDVLLRRGLLCGPREGTALLVGRIEGFGAAPMVLTPAGTERVEVAMYRLSARVVLSLELDGGRRWEAEPVDVQAELVVPASTAGAAGLEHTAALRRGWERMSREAAERLVIQLTMDH